MLEHLIRRIPVRWHLRTIMLNEGLTSALCALGWSGRSSAEFTLAFCAPLHCSFDLYVSLIMRPNHYITSLQLANLFTYLMSSSRCSLFIMHLILIDLQYNRLLYIGHISLIFSHHWTALPDALYHSILCVCLALHWQVCAQCDARSCCAKPSYQRGGNSLYSSSATLRGPPDSLYLFPSLCLFCLFPTLVQHH